MKPKVCMTKAQQVDHWKQQYLQAKANGDTTKMKMFEALIKKLGGAIPKI